jgi:DNA-binding NarL/FixJ family response regulator
VTDAVWVRGTIVAVTSVPMFAFARSALDPDVILMDLRMPGTDGVAAIKGLRRLGLRSRVLVLTTYDLDSHVVPAIEAGAIG